jgi:hypothetical protein
MIEDEIAKYFQQGFTPNQIIEKGYQKSTVYKVYQKVRSFSMQTTKPEWLITNIVPSEPRATPGQSLSLRFQFQNTSKEDMYLYRIGIWFEWMEKNTWIAQEIKDLVKSNQKRFLNFLITVPDDIKLGEYTMLFGIEAQRLPMINHQPLQTEWADPLVFCVKKPLKGTSVFLSHSTEDMTLVRQLEEQLDNEGIKVIIAEDIREPGIAIKQKLQNKIRDCSMLIALLTEDGVNSKWVAFETEYAKQINKHVIPFKEESVTANSTIEWVPFSKYDPPQELLRKVIEAITKKTEQSPLVPILGLGILLFLLLMFAGDKK